MKWYSLSTVKMGAWGYRFCESDNDLDLLWEVSDECGINLSPISDEEDAQT